MDRGDKVKALRMKDFISHEKNSQDLTSTSPPSGHLYNKGIRMKWSVFSRTDNTTSSDSLVITSIQKVVDISEM
jgi:hypothetical protein